MSVVGAALRGFGRALKKNKISSKKTPDKSQLGLAESKLKIAKAKAKSVDKLAKDVEANPHLFKAGTAFKKGHGKFGFTQPSSKPKKTIQKTKHYYAPKDF